MWDSLLYYGYQHPRWFEPLSFYSPGPEFLAAYRCDAPVDWRLYRRGLWFITNPPGKTPIQQGWKLHVSSVPQAATEVLRKCMAVLFTRGIPFKFLLDRQTLSRTSAKRWPRGSSGKFITVYPADEAEFVLVAKELTLALAGTQGPYILSDRRVPGAQNLFYRYGGITALRRLHPDGTSSLVIEDPHGNDIPDFRHPFYSKPNWVGDPFGEPEPTASLPELREGRYALSQALAYSNAGGVYIALDKTTGNEVVIKEARPHILVGNHDSDAQALLIKEYEILQLLAGSRHFSMPIELFTEWEHLFLVEEFINSEQMSTRSIRLNPVINRNFNREQLVAYYAEQQQQWLGLLAAITEAHRHGVVLADLSFTNVLIDRGDGRVVLVDLEAAVRTGIDRPVGLHTPGVSAAGVSQSGIPDAASDFYSFGALILGSVMLINAAVGYHPPALASFLDALTADLRLPAELATIITSLMRPTGDRPVDPEGLRSQIEAIDFAAHQGWESPVPIALPATEQDGITDAELDRLLVGTAALIRATADLNRTDRLFPTFLTAFETNPYSVSYGAAGVLHVLHHLDGRDNDRFVGWLLAGDWLNPQTCPPGLYSGTAGIAWVLDELGYPELAFTAMSAATDHPLVHADPGILSGTAGIGMGCLRLSRRASDPALAERALDWALMCGRWLRRTAIIDERGAHWPVNRSLAMAVEAPAQPVGYSNGASGIALFLLYLAQATGDQAWFRLGRQALDHDLSWAWSFEADFVQFPGVTHDPGGQPKVTRTYWDEGTAGVATTLLRYRVMADDDALRAAWERMRPDLCRKYVVLPQLFHGLAGIGMALQDAAELIGDAQAGLEARRLAGGLAMYAVPREDGIAWPSEQCFRESSDLATGAAGIAMFLQRLRSPVAGSSSNLNFIVDELIEGQRRR